ncbi:MAG: HNH endonuclease [Pirellulales bacterium]
MPKRVPTFKNFRIREKVIEARPNAHQRGYCSRQHRAWRKAILNRDNFKCRGCGRVLHDSSQLHADHIIPIEEGGPRYSLDNGQTLCISCHGIKTSKECARVRGRYEKRKVD